MSDTVAVRERPILFKGAMVRAILDGRKTQTRRVISHRESRWEVSDIDGFEWPYWPCYVYGEPEPIDMPCPYGEPGDHLWVRETFGLGWDSGAGFYTALPPTGHEDKPEKVFYQADGLDESQGRRCWLPSIHMKRAYSRITLEVTGVRCERLHAIGKDGRKAHDVLAEGIEPSAIAALAKWFHPDDAPALAYSALWNSINGKSHPWASNPWVWVVEFNRINEASQ